MGPSLLDVVQAVEVMAKVISPVLAVEVHHILVLFPALVGEIDVKEVKQVDTACAALRLGLTELVNVIDRMNLVVVVVSAEIRLRVVYGLVNE